MKRLIVNADDFGLSKAISEAIVKAYREGIVSSINFMPSGASFEESLYLIKDLKLEEIGAHLALTRTSSVMRPEQVRTLVNRYGRFYDGYEYLFTKLLFKKIDLQEVYLELRGQLDRLKRVDIPITNLTSHEHIHMMPALLDIFVDLAKEYSIPFIRYPHRDNLVRPLRIRKFIRTGILSLLENRMRNTIKRAGLHTTDHFIGFLDSGNLTIEALSNLLKSVKDGTTEMVCHPGHLSSYFWEKYIFQLKAEGELASLTSKQVRMLVDTNHITLTTYKKLLSEGNQ